MVYNLCSDWGPINTTCERRHYHFNVAVCLKILQIIIYFMLIKYWWIISSLPGLLRSRSSSGSIVSDYGLDDQTIRVQSPTGAEDFSYSPCVQTGSGAHPASYPMGTGGPFPGGKAWPGRDTDHLVPRLSMSRSYTSSHPMCLHGM
jgi:hypothetical protein